MFGWFRRQTRIDKEAKVLAELIFGTIGAARNYPFKEFVAIMRRSQLDELYHDELKRKFDFCIVPPPNSIFFFSLVYSQEGPRLTGEGYQQYFGLSISADHTGAIYANLSEARPRHELGIDAAALQKALLKFPYFTSLDQLRDRFSA